MATTVVKFATVDVLVTVGTDVSFKGPTVTTPVIVVSTWMDVGTLVVMVYSDAGPTQRFEMSGTLSLEECGQARLCLAVARTAVPWTFRGAR